MNTSTVSEIAYDLAGYLTNDECAKCVVTVGHVQPISLFCSDACECQAFVVPTLKVDDTPGCYPSFKLRLELFVDICGPTVTESSVFFDESHVRGHLEKLTALLAAFNKWANEGHQLPSGGELSCNSVVGRSGWVLSPLSSASCYRFVASLTLSL